MGRNNYFQFKQFKIKQEKTAMKVGTDGVLLGAWVNIADAGSILDIGTGTGLIALMLAQRSDAKITAIEIEKNAAEEAVENAEHSKWKERITVQNISFQDFVESTTLTFELIVSNPPYFTDALKNNSKTKSLARHTDYLPFYKLLQGASKLLSSNGKLAVVIPFSVADDFIQTANFYQLNVIRRTDVKPSPLRNANRILLEFSKNTCSHQTVILSILNNDGINYTDDYKNLTRDFYLNF